MSADSSTVERPQDAEELLEASWSARDRSVRGRELRIELAVTAAFAAAVAALLALSGGVPALDLTVLAVVGAYALAARTEFHVGAAVAVPTQLFLVPLFAFAPAALVPLLVFAGLALGALGAVVTRRARFDRLIFCSGDAAHSIGPALVFVLLADGHAAGAGLGVLALAFAAQLLFDSASASLHDFLIHRVKPSVELRVLLVVWSVDLALIPLGVATVAAAERFGWGPFASLPLVALLAGVAADRTRRIDAAHERLQALEHERRRHQAAVRGIGDALASTLDTTAVLQVVARAATEALEGDTGRAARGEPGGAEIAGTRVGRPGSADELLLRAAENAARTAQRVALFDGGARHAIAGPVGGEGAPSAIVCVVRDRPFTNEDAATLGQLCQQATVSAQNAAHHELLRAAEAKLRHQAYHDGLTGLPNRGLFADRVSHGLRRHLHGSRAMAVGYIDLDGFKAINDTLGHEAGDELLRVVAQRLLGCIRGGDTAARLGGDEFALLLEDLDDVEHAVQILERARRELEVPIVVSGRECAVGASIGVAVGTPEVGGEELLRHADLAMYAAKQAGGHCVQRFHSDLLSRADLHLALASDIRLAVARRELELRYQPVLNVQTGTVAAVEALLRWRHPRHGLLSPDAFLGIAEETGAIDQLGFYVLDEASRVAAGWAPSGGKRPSVCVNLSVSQLHGDDFRLGVEDVLRSRRLAPERLVLEVTESVAIDGRPEAITTLADIRKLGTRIALDDFGTGFSSLSSITQLPLDYVKLDRSFLADLERQPAQSRLVGGVLQLAGSLGLSAVVEGVERQSQLTHVQGLGGSLIQGYLLAAPMEAAELERFLAGDWAAATAAMRGVQRAA